VSDGLEEKAMSESEEYYDKRCAHEGCACLMQEDEQFCSEACENDGRASTCTCGHLACESEAVN
jgi:hypothetical protein